MSFQEPVKTDTSQNNEFEFDFALCHGDGGIHEYEYCRL